MELTPDLVIADRFRLTRPLGEGGMGAVWLAHHIRLQIPCAVKFMRAEVAADPAFRSRFDREAIAAAQIRSPHVVQVLDHGVWEGMPYIAMELLEGEDLQERLERRNKLPPDEVMTIVTQVVRALAKAHAAGLVHRDLKPANIFLVRDDDREIVKVLDFGIAKVSSAAALAAEHKTKTGAIMGSPHYMSPEQAQGTKVVDHRTDLWALAVIVYRCLTGVLPFDSDAFGDLVLKIIVEPIPIPSQIAAVPPGFDAFWRRAVSRDPAARFQSAKELETALAEALGVRAPIADPTTKDTLDGPASPAAAPAGETVRDAPLFASPTPAQTSPSAPSLSSSVSGATAPRSRAPLLAGLAAAVLIATFAFVGLRNRGGAELPAAGRESPAPPPVASSAPPAAASAPSITPSAVEPPPSAPPPVPSSTVVVPAVTSSTIVAPAGTPAPGASFKPGSGVPPRPTARPAASSSPGHDIGF